MKLVSVLGLLLVFVASSSAATCSNHHVSNQITCGSVTCAAVSDVNGGKLPTGYYYIGNLYQHRFGVPWFNLYKQKADGTGFWDYHTKIPEESCRGGFGLHVGSISEGCITITDNSCFNELSQVIMGYPIINFTVTECSGCYFGHCWGGTSQTSAPCTTDLEVIDD